MKHKRNHVIAVLMLFVLLLLALPVAAQETVTESGFSFSWTFERVLIAGLLLVVVIQQFYIFKSTPPAIAELAFGVLGDLAKKTPEQWDDKAVEAGKQIYETLKPAVSASSAAPGLATGNLSEDIKAFNQAAQK